jgi:transcriptional regulator with XRE-family HTH domain
MKSEDGTFKTKGSPVYPAVARVIKKLGSDISLARRSRRISAEDFARAMGVSRATLHRLERGDAGISLNTFAMALSALGRLDLLANLIDQTKDDVALMVFRQDVPLRISKPRARKDRSDSTGIESDPIVSDDGVEGW